jgi:hypothetical protein
VRRSLRQPRMARGARRRVRRARKRHLRPA